MTLVKFKQARPTRYYNNFAPLVDTMLNNAFGEFWGRDSFATPAVNISESADAFTIALVAPGYTKDKFELSLQNQNSNNTVLTIKGRNELEQTEHNAESDVKFLRREYSVSAFERSFTLPTTADHDNISAQYTDGILHIRIAKREEAKVREPRTIEIQ